MNRWGWAQVLVTLAPDAQILPAKANRRECMLARAPTFEKGAWIMRILIESVIVGLLGLPLAIPWIAIPFMLVRLLVGLAEEHAEEIITSSPPGDRGALASALATVAFIAIPGGVLLLALLAAAVGGAL